MWSKLESGRTAPPLFLIGYGGIKEKQQHGFALPREERWIKCSLNTLVLFSPHVSTEGLHLYLALQTCALTF